MRAPTRRRRSRRETAAALDLRLTLLEGPGLGAGAARRVGMDHAAMRLIALGLEDGLIACTDADSRPDRRWLECQFAHVRAGALAIAGLIELDPDDLSRLPTTSFAAASATPPSALPVSERPTRRRPITISQEHRWRLRPAPIGGSAVSNRWPGSRTRDSLRGSPSTASRSFARRTFACGRRRARLGGRRGVCRSTSPYRRGSSNGDM